MSIGDAAFSRTSYFSGRCQNSRKILHTNRPSSNVNATPDRNASHKLPRNTALAPIIFNPKFTQLECYERISSQMVIVSRMLLCCPPHRCVHVRETLYKPKKQNKWKQNTGSSVSNKKKHALVIIYDLSLLGKELNKIQQTEEKTKRSQHFSGKKTKEKKIAFGLYHVHIQFISFNKLEISSVIVGRLEVKWWASEWPNEWVKWWVIEGGPFHHRTLHYIREFWPIL